MPQSHLRRRLLWSLAALPGLARAHSAATALRFGVVPYLPIQQLVRLYEPVVSLFERALGQPVRLVSAADFDQFVEQARRGAFDLVAVSPHIARILQREEGYLPLARVSAPQDPVVVVPSGSAVRELTALAGKAVMVADPLAAHVLATLRLLRDHGLVAGRDFRVVVAGNQRNGVQRMLQGEADAAVGSLVSLSQLPPDVGGRIRELARAPRAITVIGYLAHARLAPRVAALGSALLAFPATAEGQAMLKASQHEGLVPFTAAELAALDPLVTEFYRQRAAR